MLRGFYTAASGILMQERTLNVLTNNMANVNTPGFRASRVVSTTFEQEFLARMEKDNIGRVGSGDPINIISDVPTRFDPNSLEETGRPFDIAINGAGFFNIQTGTEEEGNQAQYLTRDGNFDIDENNFLILRDKGRVLGVNGPIQLTNSYFTVDTNGDIYSDQGVLIDRILITDPPEGTEVELNTNGMYTTADMTTNVQLNSDEVNGTSLVQGWTERSNLDLNREYTLAMEAQRAFQALSSALQIVDKINQKAASQIASV